MKGGIRSISTPSYDLNLYELLKTYSNLKMQKAFQTITIPKLPVLTTEEGIKQIRANIQNLTDWKELTSLIPDHFKKNNVMKRSGVAGIFSASLELSKEGVINIMQKRIFDKLLIKRN